LSIDGAVFILRIAPDTVTGLSRIDLREGSRDALSCSMSLSGDVKVQHFLTKEQ
jgi:hypothetical protein